MNISRDLFFLTGLFLYVSTFLIFNGNLIPLVSGSVIIAYWLIFSRKWQGVERVVKFSNVFFLLITIICPLLIIIEFQNSEIVFKSLLALIFLGLVFLVFAFKKQSEEVKDLYLYYFGFIFLLIASIYR